MKKALKRLGERKLKPVTEKRAARIDDGEIVTRRRNAQNKVCKETAASNVSREVKNCGILLRRCQMQSSKHHQHEEGPENEQTFATGEQTRLNRTREGSKPPVKRIPRENEARNFVSDRATRESKRKIPLKSILIDDSNNCSTTTDESSVQATSILKPFLQSPEEGAVKPNLGKQTDKNRLSLSRKKLGDKEKVSESLSSLETSTEAEKVAEIKESETNSLSKLHDVENKEPHGEELHAATNWNKGASHSRKLPNVKSQEKVPHQELEIGTKVSPPNPLQGLHKQIPDIGVNRSLLSLGANNQGKVKHQEAESSISNNSKTKNNNGEQLNSTPKTRRCLIKILRIKPPDLSPKADTIPKRKSIRIRKNLATTLSTVQPKTNTRSAISQHVTYEPSRSECMSPDIFSDHDLNCESDIYAFHTQSSQSEHEDIAADIIEKMKKQGKIKLVKQKNQQIKRIGKNNTVHAANWRVVRKNLSIADAMPKDQKEYRTKKKNVLNVKNPTTSMVHVDNYDYDDHFDTDLNDPEPEPTIEVKQAKKRKIDGFSALAQKVLKEQTAIMSPAEVASAPVVNSIHNKRKLLDVAKKFVKDSNFRHSTPNKPLPDSSSASIRQKIASPSGGASPWRVDNENVPRLFYFARTSDNLPSYSSDVIPSSQPSNGSKKSNEPSKNSTATSPSRMLNDSMNISAIHDMSSIKSHNNSILNISNIENISPVKNFEDKIKENAVLVNANPRRGLAERSPLKPINILNVVTLPNRINLNQVTGKVKTSRSNKENVNAKPTLISRHKPTNETFSNNNSLKNASVASDFFGFSDDSENIDEVSEPTPKSKLPSKKRLHQKLIKLKRLLPPKPTRFSYGTIKSIFNSPNKQTDIREMLSSTRTTTGACGNAPETSRILNDSSSDDDVSSIAQDDENNTIADEDLHLFDDPAEPQPSFNASIKIRTYERPKRKAKRIHSFILFHSDSENEDDAHPTKAKRTKPDKNKKELTKFVHQFNSMCEEVDKYELVVEKDKSG